MNELSPDKKEYAVTAADGQAGTVRAKNHFLAAVTFARDKYRWPERDDIAPVIHYFTATDPDGVVHAFGVRRWLELRPAYKAWPAKFRPTTQVNPAGGPPQ